MEKYNKCVRQYNYWTIYKFRRKKWLEINDLKQGAYSTGSHIKFKSTMLRPSLCDYSDAYILGKGT